MPAGLLDEAIDLRQPQTGALAEGLCREERLERLLDDIRRHPNARVADGEHRWRAAARYGFMERPDIPALLQQAHERGCAIDISDITYYAGHETVVPGEDEKALPRWVEALFAFMQRNSAHLTEYFKLPVEAVVEIGREVSI
jgi:K+ transporter